MKKTLQNKRFFYGRLVVSVGLFCAFIIASVMAQLTRTTEPPSLVIGGLIIGAVLILPRSTRRVSARKDSAETDAGVAHLQRLQKWLTGVRVIYLAGAIFVWLALPEFL